MRIDLVQLRTFVAVAEEQHLTRAAERLHVSQSAASAHVRAVEDALGTQLFVRTNRSLELTNAGQLLMARARTLLNDAEGFMSFARELHGKADGTLIVGTSSEPETRIGAIVGALRKDQPLLTVDLRARTSASARQGLRNGELDICILLGDPVDPGLTHYELSRIQFRIAGPIGWRDRIETASLAELARLPWIAPADPNSAYSGMFTALFKDRGLDINAVATFDNPALGRLMLHGGVGLALMREEYVRGGIEAGTLAASPVARTDFALSIAHQADRKKDPLIRAFLASAAAIWPESKLPAFNA
jgi:DNA-binding transcriptional LysR family regulator